MLGKGLQGCKKGVARGKVARVQGGLQEEKKKNSQNRLAARKKFCTGLGFAQPRTGAVGAGEAVVRGVLWRGVVRATPVPGSWGDRALRVGTAAAPAAPQSRGWGPMLEGGGAFTPCQGMRMVPGAAVSPEVGSG